MLYGKTTYTEEPFELEKELEESIIEVAGELFGRNRIYLDVKKKIGAKGKVNNIPDGYLIDLSSTKEPKLYVVEVELAKHDPLKHVSVQVLEFSLSFETAPILVKNILKESLLSDNTAVSRCQKYVQENGYDNIDVLLEKIIYGSGKFNALVIIDGLLPELETVLISRFKFPVEILTIERYRSKSGERLYRFQPFLNDLTSTEESKLPPLDPSEIDTIVVPAKEDGFNEVFIGQNRWYSIRIHASMIPKIKYIAVYRVAPESAITHIAKVASIDLWEDTNKYVVNFASPAEEIKPIKLIAKSKVKAPQAPRYTSKDRIDSAKNLDEVF